MSISNEITRITADRNTIRNKFINLGIATSTATLDDLADAADDIVNRGAPAAEVKEGEQYTIQPGYYSGGSVAGVSGGGNYNLQSKTVSPTKQQQSVSPDSGYYGLSSVIVSAIPNNYQDVSSVTAVATDVLANKIIVGSNGSTISGTMPENGTVTKTLDATTGNQSYTIPAGHHSGSGAVSINLETKTATPTTSSQDITPTNGKVLGKVTVAAIPDNYGDVTGADASAENLLVGTSAVLNVDDVATVVEGTMPNNGSVTKVLDATTNNQSYTVPTGYHNGSGTVSISLETKTATPTTATQNVTPTSGKVLSKVVVNPIPANYGNTTGTDAVAGDLAYGKKAMVNVNGTATLITGSLVNNGAISGSIDGLTTMSYTIPSGITSGGSVSLTDDIETALAAI